MTLPDYSHTDAYAQGYHAGRASRHNAVHVHLTEGDLLVLERSLPDEVFRRSEAQHIVSRIVTEARHQHVARAQAAKR